MVVTELGRLGGISVDGRRSVVFPASGQEAQRMWAWMSTVSMETGQKWSRVLGWGWGARELGPQILILCSYPWKLSLL